MVITSSKNFVPISTQWLQRSELNIFKGIDRPFELRGVSRLIRSVITKWMLRKFFFLILKGLHHKISKKPWDAA
jgi:hypothetical protein